MKSMVRRRVMGAPKPRVGTGQVVGRVPRAVSEPEEQQRVAVLVSEIAGYGRMVRGSKKFARQARSRFRAVIADATAHHGGRVVQAHGGRARAEFRSAILAVRAAAEIQRNGSEGELDGVTVAVHLAEVNGAMEPTHDELDVANRVLGLATDGEVLMSGTTTDELEGATGTAAKSLGSFMLDEREEALEVSVLVRVAGRSLGESQLWTPGWSTRAKRYGAKLKTTAALMGGAVLFDLVAASASMPEWFVEGAAFVVLLDWLGPFKLPRI